MNKTTLAWVMVLVGLGVFMIISPELAHAQFAGGLESKVQGVTGDKKFKALFAGVWRV